MALDRAEDLHAEVVERGARLLDLRTRLAMEAAETRAREGMEEALALIDLVDAREELDEVVRGLMPPGWTLDERGDAVRRRHREGDPASEQGRRLPEDAAAAVHDPCVESGIRRGEPRIRQGAGHAEGAVVGHLRRGEQGVHLALEAILDRGEPRLTEGAVKGEAREAQEGHQHQAGGQGQSRIE